MTKHDRPRTLDEKFLITEITYAEKVTVGAAGF